MLDIKYGNKSLWNDSDKAFPEDSTFIEAAAPYIYLPEAPFLVWKSYMEDVGFSCPLMNELVMEVCYAYNK